MEKADYSEAMEVVRAPLGQDNEDIQALSSCLPRASKYSSETVGTGTSAGPQLCDGVEEGRYGMAAKDGTRKIRCTYEYLGAYDKDTGVIPAVWGIVLLYRRQGNKKLVGDNTYQYLGSFGDGFGSGSAGRQVRLHRHGIS